jgi:hypothetical protein
MLQLSKNLFPKALPFNLYQKTQFIILNKDNVNTSPFIAGLKRYLSYFSAVCEEA